jgi:hypothetical protein
MVLDFLDLSRLIGLSPGDWNVRITYNIDFPLSEANKQKNLFSKCAKIPSQKIVLRPSNRVRKYTYRLWISTTLLFEVVNKIMNEMRRYLTRKPHEKLLRHFVQGLLAGDGNFNYHRDRSLHTRLEIFESNREFVEDYAKILRKFGLKGRIGKSKNRNLYILNVPTNWNNLITIFGNDLLVKSPENYKKLIEALKLHQKTRIHSYLRLLRTGKSVREIKTLLDWQTCRVKEWLNYRERDGFIYRIGKKYFLTKKGIKLVDLLRKLGHTSI